MKKEKWIGYMKTGITWVVNICYYSVLLFLIAMLVQVFCLTSFKIPSDSMEPSLLAGDKILVNKMRRGARLFNVFASLRGEDVDIYRLPALGKFKRNDVLVFNFPYQPARWDSICFDVMTYYVKRCIALPGDTLEIRKGFYHIRGVDEPLGNLAAQQYLSQLTDSTAYGVVMQTFPWDSRLNWTIQEFGPLPVPAKGQLVQMDSLSYLLYRQLINWEQKKKLRAGEGKVYLGDSLITQYRFEQNYYFVSGDKMANSRDSRYWGLLPEPYIVGNAFLIWRSDDRATGKIRWERVFRKIK